MPLVLCKTNSKTFFWFSLGQFTLTCKYGVSAFLQKEDHEQNMYSVCYRQWHGVTEHINIGEIIQFNIYWSIPDRQVYYQPCIYHQIKTLDIPHVGLRFDMPLIKRILIDW